MMTMSSLLARTVRLWGRRVAMIDGDTASTWAEFAERVALAASALASCGLQRGERFALIAHNSVRQAELLYAGYHLGAVPVPINYRLAAKEIGAILDDSASKMLIVDDAFSELLESDELGSWKARAFSLNLRPLIVDALNVSLEIDPLCSLRPDRDSVTEDDDALLLYTGGTTGRSKGVRLSHRNLATVALQNAAVLTPRADDIYLHVAPMFHSADLLSNSYLACGAAHIYLAKPSARLILETIARNRITATVVPPTLIILALQDERFGDFDLSSLRTMVFGSAPMPESWIVTARDAIPGMDLWHGYGLTETAQMLTLGRVPRPSEKLDSMSHASRVRSAGCPLIGTDLRIVDSKGFELPAGMAGEVVARGPQIAKGYLNLPEETVGQFRDGWFYTGDIGSVDQDGWLYLLDRKRDMVITGGENVYTFEVEEALTQHPEIVEAAVFGVPDEVYGESLVAVLVQRNGARVPAEEMIEHCRKMIGGFKIPRRIYFLNELPKNTLGKIAKNELRRQYTN
jgi:long-chain acyl-CoA synthetase